MPGNSIRQLGGLGGLGGEGMGPTSVASGVVLGSGDVLGIRMETIP